MIPQIKSKKDNPGDNLYTPDYATAMIHKFTPKKWKIWEPCCGTGNIVNYYRKAGYNIVGTDIETGHDFFTHIESDFDCIITNPPYSRKTECINRCLELNKPFALLMPTAAHGSNERHELWKQVDVETLNPDHRIEYMTDTKCNIYFDTNWFCVGFDIRAITGRSNNYIEINKPGVRRKKNKQLTIC